MRYMNWTSLLCALVVSSHVHAQNQPAKAASSSSNFTQGVDCVSCHSTTTWKQNTMGASGGASGFDHDKTHFPLRGQHRFVGCVNCHKPNQKIKTACVSCHQDPHQSRLGRMCESCHSTRAWNETRALEMHRRTRFPLSGMHVLADCTQCHQRRGEREWSFPPADCYACHENDYKRPGLLPSHVGAAGQVPFPRDCSICHRPAGWRPAKRDAVPLRTQAFTLGQAPPDHDATFRISSGFHQGAACTTCHLSAEVPRMVRCDGCHAHDAPSLTRAHKGKPVPTSGQACLSCHPGGMAR